MAGPVMCGDSFIAAYDQLILGVGGGEGTVKTFLKYMYIAFCTCRLVANAKVF